MTPEEAVRAVLQTFGPVTALVSTRIHLQKYPQSPTYPCVRVLIVSEQTVPHLRGIDGLKSARVQVDASAKELSGIDPYALAAAVADTVYGDGAGGGLAGYHGDIGSPAFHVDSIVPIDRRSFYDPDELRVLTISQDFRVWFRA